MVWKWKCVALPGNNQMTQQKKKDAKKHANHACICDSLAVTYIPKDKAKYPNQYRTARWSVDAWCVSIVPIRRANNIPPPIIKINASRGETRRATSESGASLVPIRRANNVSPPITITNASRGETRTATSFSASVSLFCMLFIAIYSSEGSQQAWRKDAVVGKASCLTHLMTQNNPCLFLLMHNNPF